ncbi:putative Fiber protein Fb17 [Melia azedarach]|uniref:Fiber protein Fb17 n=1 Tax=Melia azedarach TaxID=155640 RepID=A0ACC1XMQ7_MELAZ|nr:putative Fiber protein Fb17 [Melia azedarach]
MLLLERNRGDVLLRKVNKELTDKVIGNVNKELTDKVIGKGLGLTYNDIVKSYSMEENNKMNGFIWKIRRKLGSISLPLPREGEVSISRSFPYSDDDILWFMATLYDKQRKTQLTEPKDVEAEVVNVGDYIIVPNLVPILKNLLDKYGDISGYCTLTQNLKTYPLSVFCSTVESMSSTKVMDITNELMLTWWCSLEFVRKVGFEIDFVFDHLKRIVHARYGTDIENYKSSPVYKLHEQMAQLSKEIDELGAEINKRREKMDELRKQTADIISSNRSERSRLEAKHLSEALEFRRKNAATGLL